MAQAGNDGQDGPAGQPPPPSGPPAAGQQPPPPPGAPAAGQPSVSVLAQYVKDLSFENPGAPATMTRQKAPNIKITISVVPRTAAENEYEVELKIDARATDGDTVIFAIELVYAGMFRVANIPAQEIGPLTLIECPRLLFPFARQIISDAARNGGFPPLLIDPVDFVALYRQRLAAEQQRAQQQPPGNA